jgi:hypothetical protein
VPCIKRDPSQILQFEQTYRYFEILWFLCAPIDDFQREGDCLALNFKSDRLPRFKDKAMYQKGTSRPPRARITSCETSVQTPVFAFPFSCSSGPSNHSSCRGGNLLRRSFGASDSQLLVLVVFSFSINCPRQIHLPQYIDISYNVTFP